MSIDGSRHLKLRDLSCRVIAAYVSKNAVPAIDLPNFIRLVHDAIAGLSVLEGGSSSDRASLPTPREINGSIQGRGIVSFIDGRTYKTLKRHLSAHGLDPKSYRERFGLPSEYPMVAPEYAKRRSDIAKGIGLGKIGAMTERQRRDRRAA